ncbi:MULTISPECIES: hypothetical protein [unclassified Synechococcus]|uniref:hypothetical protein n=1 Tax=unclassified Synechococcus TaxID=2626047 RepID=UPI0018CCA35A|nr:MULTISPECIES: hypothetical protein [unclassified Synechococcus]MEA5424572.1 hypothetical protein [Synechococcus sp. CCY9202]QPN59221.1 hypothetical protein H8F24_14280 [Synechococcus sp. CBW1002]QPN66009.1 hypothetical protein H8F26_14360 [Synechococcus sp. CBW1006]
MSHLREIMQRLNAKAPSPATPPAQLEGHLTAYERQLHDCSDSMLQYEAVWLEEHLQGLDLCASKPEMRAAAGGAAHVALLRQESERFISLLHAEMERRELQPARHRAAVVPTEHAWELTNPAIRQAWGIDVS